MLIKSPVLIFTGGHHTSGLAVAEELQKSDIFILWFGHRQSLWGEKTDSAEYREVVGKGIRFVELKAGKFHRTVNPLKLVRIPLGFFQALFYLLRYKIKFGSNLRGIVSFGGYLAVPVALSGWIMGIPVITYEQTMVSGWANRLISRFSIKVAISWPSSSKFFPAQKTVLVGLPLRPEILAIKNVNFTPGQEKYLYITGGKQGSHVLNKTVFGILNKLLDKYNVIHQTGTTDLHQDLNKANNLKSDLPRKLYDKYRVFGYLSSREAADALKRSDIVISRAGAHITAELLYLEKKSVLIPIPWGSHNEQEINANYLKSLNRAVILKQSELNPKNLLKAIFRAELLKPKSADISPRGVSNLVSLIRETFHL